MLWGGLCKWNWRDLQLRREIGPHFIYTDALELEAATVEVEEMKSSSFIVSSGFPSELVLTAKSNSYLYSSLCQSTKKVFLASEKVLFYSLSLFLPAWKNDPKEELPFRRGQDRWLFHGGWRIWFIRHRYHKKTWWSFLLVFISVEWQELVTQGHSSNAYF